MNEYATLKEFKVYAGVSKDNTDHDALIRDILTWSSRQMDRITRRFFYEMTQTRKFDCPTATFRDLMFDWPLLSLTTLTNGNAATIGSTNYFLYPDPNTEPFLWLELRDDSGIVWEYSTTPQQAIQVLGEWGWHEEYGEAWENSGATSGALSAGGTTLTPSGNMPKFEQQQILKIESEQVYITDVQATTMTMERGKNGTTDADHASGKAIYIYRPQWDIRHICLRLALWRYKQKDAIFEVGGYEELATWEVPTAMPRDIVKDLRRFRKP